MKTFPVFLKMDGKRALVLGGGEQAAQKVRLLLKTDVEILVVAESLEPELAAYLEEGRISHQTGDVTATLMRTAVLVYSASGCLGAGAAHAALAKDAGVLINVVDQSAYCDVMTPSIVDRDPVTVAIGTEGSAPVLGRLIKSQIETLLEPDLGAFARFAGRMRAMVAQFVPPQDRRAFWRWVFSEEPRQEFARGNQSRAFDRIKSAIKDHGKVALAPPRVDFVAVDGAALGELTLSTLRRLQEADVIYYARNSHENVLEFARRDAERVAYAPGTAPETLIEGDDSANKVVLLERD